MTSIQIMTKTSQNDDTNHRTGVNPLIVRFNAAVIMPGNRKIRSGARAHDDRKTSAWHRD